MARAKREGVYQPGIGMDGGYTTEDLDGGDKRNKGARRNKKNKKKTATDKVCPHCGKVGHVRKTSKYCDYNSTKRAAIVGPSASDDTPKESEITAANRMAADEVDDADALPLSDDCDSDNFYDAKDEFTSGSEASIL